MMDARTSCETLARRLHDRLPLVYLVFCVPFGLAYCFIVPPLLVPDEWAHFSRAVQISYGDVIGEKPEGGRPGGQVPRSLTTFLSDPRFTRRLPSKKAAAEPTDPPRTPPATSRLRFEEETEFHVCPFIRYPPSSYLFGSGAVWLGRAWQLDALSIFYLARLCTFVPSAFMGWLALEWISSGRLFAFFTLSTPAILSLFGSCSQDAALISFTALAVGFVQRFLTPAAGCPPAVLPSGLFWGSLAASAAVGAVAAGRPPYLPMVGIVPLFFLAATRRWREAAILAAVAVAVPAAWLWATRGLGSGNEFGSDHAGQVRFILAHPWQSVAVFFRSVWDYVYGTSYLRHLVAERPNGGPLSLWIYQAAGLAFVVTIARDAWLSRNTTRRDVRLATVVLLCGAFFAIHLAGYVYFTPVGAENVRGIQGRYLAPILLAVTFVLGHMPSGLATTRSSRVACLLDLGSLALAFGVIAVANVASTINIMRNFYYP
jgi:uncharacterized membrane protein